MNKRLLVLLFALAPLGLRAADTLSLDQALSTALANNPELRKLRLTADAAEWKRAEARAAYIPHLSVHASHDLGMQYGMLHVVFGGAAIKFPEAMPQSEVDLGVSWTLFDGLGAWGAFKASGLEAEAAGLEARYAETRAAQAVKLRFYKALAAQQLVTVADQNILTLEDHASLADASERAGFATRVDVLRIGSQLEEARAEKLLAEDNAALTRRDLFQALGVSPSAAALEGSLPVPATGTVSADLSLDPSQRADFVALQQRHDSLEDLQSSALAGVWAPKLSVFGGEQFYHVGDFDPSILPSDGFESAYAYGFKLSWDLFDGGSDWAKYQQSKDAVSRSLEDQRKLALSAADEFEAAKRHYVYNTALYEARLRSVEKSEESVRLAILGVKAGSQTQAQALDAELDLFRARAGVIRAQVDAAEALSTLEQALGHAL
jgi:outer membrane protein TolC